MRAATAAACIARFSCRGVNGSSGFWPETATALEHLALRMGVAPPRAQALEQQRRQHGVAILVALALFNAQDHALAVDIADLQRNDFAGTQSRTVGHR